MIRDALAVFFTAGALGWGIRLLWMGTPTVQPESAPQGPWIDESGAAMMARALDELEPSLKLATPAAASPAAQEVARVTLAEPADAALSQSAEALARCVDAARALDIEVRWARTAAIGDQIVEAEFRSAVDRAVPFWNALLNATEASPLMPRACRWSLVEPLSENAATEIIGRVRFELLSADAAEFASAGAEK